MKNVMAITRNVMAFLAAVKELQDPYYTLPRMGLLWGRPGEGKTTTVAYGAAQTDAIFLRANVTWSVTSLLRALLVELGKPEGRFKERMLNEIVAELMANPRPILIDESDYLLRQREMLDVLRDIYDTTLTPVIMIGMEDLARKVQSAGRLGRRVTQWVQFDGIDIEDGRKVADACCEATVADDLLEELFKAADGNIGRIVAGLSRIEKLGRTQKIPPDTPIALADWGRRTLFFDQPRFRRGGRR